ncbi:MAG: glycosyltransferase family 4 protein [Lacunisphaera sp.]|nr:glycosyltransferase family 4 protein [Lacunisphaera sp.]
MLKAIFVSQVFHPDEQATGQLLSDLVCELSARGMNCEVLAGFPAAALREQCPRSEQWRGVNISRGGWRVNGKRSLLQRAMGYASYCLWLVWRLLFFVPSHARVLVVTNPPFAPVLVFFCSLLRGWRYDVILHDIYPDGLVAVESISNRAIIVRLWRWCNRQCLGRAGTVIVLGRDMARLVAGRYGVSPARIECVPNWSPYVPGKDIKAESTALWSRLKLEGKFVVQYSGNMGLWHDIESIVRTADLLKSESDILFLLIGEGRRRAAAEQLSRDLGLANIIWLPFQPREKISDTLATCHVALISQRDGLAGIAVPSKLYGILASGRAVLAQVPAESETAMVVREEDCGLVIPTADAQALADAIRKLAYDRQKTGAMGARASAAYRAKYQVRSAVARFEQILKSDRPQ